MQRSKYPLGASDQGVRHKASNRCDHPRVGCSRRGRALLLLGRSAPGLAQQACRPRSRSRGRANLASRPFDRSICPEPVRVDSSQALARHGQPRQGCAATGSWSKGQGKLSWERRPKGRPLAGKRSGRPHVDGGPSMPPGRRAKRGILPALVLRPFVTHGARRIVHRQQLEDMNAFAPRGAIWRVGNSAVARVAADLSEAVHENRRHNLASTGH